MSQPDPKRLFVGNLNYRTTAAELGKKFEEFGPVKEAVIVARGTMSQGYGFVTMEEEKGARDAQAALNNKELDGRTVHVEFARSTGPHQPGPRPAGARPPRRGRFGRGRFGRRGRGRRAPRPVDPNAPLSQTRIYIRNLPFSLSDAAFKEAFPEYKVTEATIIRSYNGSSRGYGFIECENAAEQQRVLKEKKDMVFKDRNGRERTAYLAPARERPAPTQAPSN